MILKNVSSASWSGPVNSANGSCDDGQSGPLNTLPGGQSRAKTTYEVMDGSSGTVTKTITFSATVSATGTNQAGTQGKLNANAGATTSRIQPVLQLDGTAWFEAKSNTIIDKKVIGSVSHPTEIRLDNPAWSVPGDTFASFVRGPNDDWGRQEDCPPGTFTSPNPSWVWRRKLEAGVIAYSGQLYALGQYWGAVQLQRKIKCWDFDEIGGNPVSGPGSIYYNGDWSVGAGGIGTSGEHIPGIEFQAYYVWTPQKIRATLGAGNWVFYQKCLIARHVNIGFGSYVSPEHELDNSYPYSEPPPETPAVPNAKSREEDSPNQGVSVANEFSISDNYTMYMVYQAEGSRADVTVWETNWAWTAQGSRISPAPWQPRNAGPVTVGVHGPSREPIQWNRRYGNRGGQ